MLRLRLLLVAAGLAAVAAFAAPRALAIPSPSCTPSLPQSIGSAHFRISYNDDPTRPEFLTATQAGAVLATAERTYASFIGMGFPPPLAVVSSGRTEISIMDLGPWKASAFSCTAMFDLDAKVATSSTMPYTIGTTIFDQIELRYASTDWWLMNGASAWASWRALGYPSESIVGMGPFDMSLDCASAPDMANCSKVGYENLGESRWPFYEYLAEQFGTTFILNVLTAANLPGATGLSGLQNALIAKKTTLAAEYGSYAAQLMYGGWTATPLNAATIPISGTKILTGSASGAIPPQSFAVNHLAARYVEIDRGDGAGDHACYAATLTLNVQIPSGVTSQPTFYWSAGRSAPIALTISGNTATTTMPWDTCAWPGKGYLSLPNTSMVDGGNFVVSGTLAVDFTSPATAVLPPAPATPYGQVIPVSSLGVAPTISLFGPELLKLSAQDAQVRLIVQSGGEGTVNASIGSVALGTAALIPGGNDLRFPIPKELLLGLRRSASSSVLTLTPVSPDGKTTGTAVTRTISLAPAAAPAKKTVPAKPKHAAKKSKSPSK
jgi:hypothetical protein